MFARTQRLMLRPGWPEDAQALARAIGHEEIVRMLGRAPWPYTICDAVAFLNMPRTDPRAAELLITNVEGAAPVLIGGVGLVPMPDGDIELGYWLTPAAWGRGYATEAGRAMLDIARHTLGLTRVRAGHFADNPASGRVLRKLGFVETGRARRGSLARRDDVESVEMIRDFAAEEAPLPMAA